MTTCLEQCFAELSAQNRPAFVAFIMAGDTSAAVTSELLAGLPGAGVDIIELGMPFTDPMADGPAIQMAGQRALDAGMTLKGVLQLVREFRATNSTTPLILMGYYNPIYSFGVANFLTAAKAAGVDGLIVVDLPPEEDDELCLPARAAGLHFIRLATPTTDAARLPAVLANTSGFVYYVSITGITGAARANTDAVAQAVARIKQHTALPVCVGFGVKDAESAAAIGRVADGVVVGSAIVERIGAGQSPTEVLKHVAAMADAAHHARR